MIKNVVDMGLMPGTTTRSTAIKGGPAVSGGCDRGCLVLRGGPWGIRSSRLWSGTA